MGCALEIDFRTPGHIDFSWYDASRSVLRVVVSVRKSDSNLRLVDSWLMAVAAYLDKNQPGRKIKAIHMELKSRPDEFGLESFRRRMAYHAINRKWTVKLVVAGKVVPLEATPTELLSPAPGENAIYEWTERENNKSAAGRVEKMLQTWLGDSVLADAQRLVVLGRDFLFDKNHPPVQVEREVPMGVFLGEQKEKNRVLSTNYADLVTMNRHGRVSVLELKIGDIGLSILGQALEYALFLARYWEQLAAKADRLKFVRGPRRPFDVYFVSNVYHPRFDAAASYLQAQEGEWGFRFIKIRLGETTDFSPVP